MEGEAWGVKERESVENALEQGLEPAPWLSWLPRKRKAGGQAGEEEREEKEGGERRRNSLCVSTKPPSSFSELPLRLHPLSLMPPVCFSRAATVC